MSKIKIILTSVFVVMLTTSCIETGSVVPTNDSLPRDVQQQAVHKSDSSIELKKIQSLAERGKKEAQYNLGLKYLNGDGVPQNYPQAIKWFNSAAKKGNTDAQKALALMFIRGQGRPHDDYDVYLFDAYVLFGLAAKLGDYEAKTQQNLLRNKIDNMFLERAQWLINNWKLGEDLPATFVYQYYFKNIPKLEHPVGVEDFGMFLAKFSGSPDFQESRLLFPIKYRWLDLDAEISPGIFGAIKTTYLNKNSWRFINLKEENIIQHLVNINNDKSITYHPWIHCTDCDTDMTFTFVLKNRKWFLSEFLNEST